MLSNNEQITRDMLRREFEAGYRISFMTGNDAVMTYVSFHLPRPTPLNHLPLKHAYQVSAGTMYVLGFEQNSLVLYVSDNMGRPIHEAPSYIPAPTFYHGVEFMPAGDYVINARM